MLFKKTESLHTARCRPGCLAIGLACVAAFTAAEGAETGADVTVSEASSATPEFYAPKTLHYFGNMQPGQVSTHSFVVKNTGSAPLQVTSVKGSCKCLEFKVEPEVIPPGGEGLLKVTWRAVEKKGETFRQLVRVETNAPKTKRVDFVVSGEVGGHLRLEPGRVEWKNARAGEPQTAKVRVATNYWPELHVSDIESSLKGLECELVEANDPRARVVTIRAPESLTKKSFTALLNMTVAPSPAGPEQRAPNDMRKEVKPVAARAERASTVGSAGLRPVKIQIPVSFGLGAPLQISGAGYSQIHNALIVGAIDPTGEKRPKLLIKVRDPEKRLTVVEKTIEPDFVEVNLQEYKTAAGLYRLEIVLPPDRLDRAYVGETAGRLRLVFDHPRITELELKLEMSPRR